MIHHYLNKLFDHNPRQILQIKPNQIAHNFQSLPSQINYLINTPFTTQTRYILQTNPRGRAYIPIIKLK
ncbi:CtsR family transcriptional regulator, partial [Bacillus altitudinis]|uniref:CtsR family transcriptional regulator n=1 Tax=Bacillus altitudinis TaxID=293387 RepID=UPI003B51DBBC